MFPNPFEADSAKSDVRGDAHRRMLAARDHVRRWFSPEAMAGIDPDAPEVIGERTGLPSDAESPAYAR